MSEYGAIVGKVARVLNAREIAINKGALDGVRVGMKFAVLDKKLEDIRDPDTNEILGSFSRPKVEVKVVEVEDRVSRAETFRYKRVNIGGSGAFGTDFSRFFKPPEWVIQHETLKTDEATWADLDESESLVKTGDPVRQVVEPDRTIEISPGTLRDEGRS